VTRHGLRSVSTTPKSPRIIIRHCHQCVARQLFPLRVRQLRNSVGTLQRSRRCAQVALAVWMSLFLSPSLCLSSSSSSLLTTRLVNFAPASAAKRNKLRLGALTARGLPANEQLKSLRGTKVHGRRLQSGLNPADHPRRRNSTARARPRHKLNHNSASSFRNALAVADLSTRTCASQDLRLACTRFSTSRPNVSS